MNTCKKQFILAFCWKKSATEVLVKHSRRYIFVVVDTLESLLKPRQLNFSLNHEHIGTEIFIWF